MLREGDLVEDSNSVIFDVKGLVHPFGRVVAFPRFVPDKEGDRKRSGIRYRKIYALSARYEFLKKNFLQYLVQDPVFDEMLCEVPLGAIKHQYIPIERLHELRCSDALDLLEQDALDFAIFVKENANVPFNSIGVAGSILARLFTTSSDIDLIIYGNINCRKLYSTLTTLTKDPKGPLKPYRIATALRKLFKFRSQDTHVNFEDFVRTEKRKVLQGTYKSHDYFIRCVKNWQETNERYGDVSYTNVGYAKIKATVCDDFESIFTPCTYKVENSRILEGTNDNRPIVEIVSFRGRFNEHARKGETVIARGKIEHACNKQKKEWQRLLLGNKPTDFMILA